MRINPQRRVVVVSAISGVLVFGAAGFAAAAVGGTNKVQAPVIAPAAATDPAATDTVAPTVGGVDTSVSDDNGTEVENTEGTEVENETESTEVENESDDNGGDDQGDDNGGNSGQGGGDHGGDHGGDNGGGGDGD